MKNMQTHLIAKSIAALTLACLFTLAAVPVASSADGWKESFEDICSKVDASGNLSEKELTALVARADKLLPEIQAANDPSKKVYLQRLKKCRSMYEFMIDARKSSGK
jgi:hypothetical protein